MARTSSRTAHRQRQLSAWGYHLIHNSAAYTTLAHGHGGNPTAPLYGVADFDPTHATVADGDRRGQHGREPVLVRCTNGDILQFNKARSTDNATNGDKATYAILMYRSTDKGATWESPQVAVYATGYESSTFTKQVRSHGVWVNPATGRVHLIYIRLANAGATVGDWKWYSAYSDDHGATWESEVEITAATQPTTDDDPFDVTGAAGGWGFSAMYSHGVTGQDGRGIMLCYHRTTADNSGTAYTHAIVCTDDENWVLAGGPLESHAANENTIEPRGGLRSDGQAFVICHNKLTSKAMATIAPATAEGTWQDYAVQDGSGLSVDGVTTSTDLQGIGCPYGITQNGSKLYLQGPCDSAVGRSHLKIWQSSDDGVSWPVSRILHRNPAGYSDMLAVDSGSFISVYEGTKATLVADTDAASGSQNAFYNEQGLVSRWPLTWLTQPENHLDYAHWVFNEATSGAIPTEGRPIKDRGTLQSHAYGGSAGTFTADGIAGDGTGLAAVLCDHVRTTSLGFPSATNGSALDPLLDSWTLEVVDLDLSNTASAIFLSSRTSGTGAGTGAGVAVLRATSNRLSISVNDGTNPSKTLLTAGDFVTGTPKTFRLEIDRAENKMRAYADGVLSLNSVATDISSGLGSIVSAQRWCLGSHTDGATGTEGSFTCGPIRITRGIRTGGFLTGSEERQSLINFYGGYTSPATFSPITDLTGLKMWVGRTDDGSYGARHDYEGWDTHEIPAVAGRSFRTFQDPVLAQRWTASESYSSGWHLVEDDYVGKFYMVNDSGNGPKITRARLTAAGSLLDFPQETGEFCFYGCFNRRSAAAALILFDTNNYAAAVGTLFLLPTTGTTLGAFINKDGPTSLIGNYYNHGISGGWALNTWYALAIVGRGAGVPLEYYVKPFASGRTPPTFTTTTGTTANLGTPGTGASTQAVSIGQKQDGSITTHFAFKNIMLFDNPLGADVDETTDNLDLLAAFSAEY